MTLTATTTFEAQLRDTNTHDSNTASDESGVTVVEDTHHHQDDADATDTVFAPFTEFVVYATSDLDQAVDIDIETTRAEDTAYDDTVAEATLNLTATDGAARTRLSGVVPRLRYHFQAQGTASTQGSVRLVCHAVGPWSRE